MDSAADNDFVQKPEPSPLKKPRPSTSNGANGSAPPPKKRARKSQVDSDDDDHRPRNTQGGEDQNMNDADSDSEDEGPEARQHVRDVDGYVPGSIVRVALVNFVTYDKVEFSPGPSLNMVLGPNGTGKSTLACAIALGLGFPPKVLGRSGKLAEFVKTGYEESTIEIELKGLPGQGNATIKRILNKDNDKSKFTLNGQSATAKEISSTMEELNVQVGNLCTFLPQDRVASFAALSAADLLKETQKAAGDRHLTQWHTTLIEEKKLEKEHRTALDEDSKALTRHQTKQAETEREVKSFETRRQLEYEQTIIGLLVNYAEYYVARDVWNTAKSKRAELTSEVAELEAANAPFMQSKASLEITVKHFGEVKKANQSKINRATKDTTEVGKLLEKCEKDVSKIRDTLGDIKKDEKERKKRIGSLQKETDRLQGIVDRRPEPVDEGGLAAEITDKTNARNAILPDLDEILAELDDVKRQLSSNLKNQSQIDRQIEQHLNTALRREEDLRKDDNWTYVALKWFRAHKHEFKGDSCEPLRVSLSVKEKYKNNVGLAEAPLSRAIFKTFIFELQEDYDYMMREVNDKVLEGQSQKIRCNAAQLGTGAKRLADVRRKFSDAQLADFGFDCLAIDMLDGPEIGLVWLCESHIFAGIPISLGKNPIDAKKVENSGQVSRYYTPDGSHSIKWSQYGARGSQVEQRNLSPPRILNQAADNSKLAPLQEQSSRLKSEQESLKTKGRECTARDQELRARVTELDNEKAELADRRVRLREPMKKWLKAEAELKSKQTELQKQLSKPSAEAKRDKARKDMLAQTAKRVQYTLDYQNLFFKTADLYFTTTTCQLQSLQAENDLRAMANSASEKDRELNEKKTELDEVTASASALFKKAKTAMAHAAEMLDQVEPDVKADAESRDQTKSLETLNREMDEITAQLDLIQPVSKKILDAYEERKKQIAVFEDKVIAGTAKLNKAVATITKVLNKWLPKLEALVQSISKKFSDAFNLLGCLGEIVLSKGDDYDKWGIEIRCSFRDGESLQVLTAHRQSGGERALTTVMYLMALAELAKAPFALVDEINQGMDQRVERNVHNALVGTTCKDDVGQYFLITPKLLPNLEYHPKMKVLIINNGDWIPERLSLEEVVKNKTKMNRGERSILGRTVPK